MIKEGDKVLIEAVVSKIFMSGRLKIKLPNESIYFGHIYILPEHVKKVEKIK